MTKHSYDIQGRFLGLPYDFRRPTLAKVLRRIYSPGGPLLVPKAFGCGWTFNFAHRGSLVLLVGLAAFTMLAALIG